MQRLDPGGHDDVPRFETLSNDDGPRVMTQQFHISYRHRQMFGTDAPSGGLPIEFSQGTRGDGYDGLGYQLDAASNRGTQPHRFRRVAETDLDLEGPG